MKEKGRRRWESSPLLIRSCRRRSRIWRTHRPQSKGILCRLSWIIILKTTLRQGNSRKMRLEINDFRLWRTTVLWNCSSWKVRSRQKLPSKLILPRIYCIHETWGKQQHIKWRRKSTHQARLSTSTWELTRTEATRSTCLSSAPLNPKLQKMNFYNTRCRS